MQEKRKSQRHRTLKGGTIAFRQLGATIDCVVRNLSDSGALLVVTSPLGVPDRFELVVQADQSVRQCRVVWRTERQIGVAFGR